MESNNHPRKRVAIVGLGPVGQILAVHLRETDVDLMLCDMDKGRMHLIQKDGIQLTGAMQKQATFEHYCTSVRDILPFKPDIIVFAVKAYHLQSLVREMSDFPREGILYISA